jgi:hypothetical protein
MICHVVPRKNINHGIPRFQRKTLHKKWHQAGLHLAFYPIDHGLCKFHRKLLNLDPIFGRDVYLSKANNFYNYGFLTCHIKDGFSILLVPKRAKTSVFCEVATKIIVQIFTTQIFMGGVPC